MKLYYYEHCPFSTKARMALNLKRIEAQRHVLLADDERTITALIGRHSVPVLVKDDGEPMAESLEIVEYLDRLDGKPQIDEYSTAELNEWIDALVPALQYLGYPRLTRIGLAEFATPAAYEHFRKKKSETIGDFAEAVANTPAKVREVDEQLAQLPALVDLDAGRERLRLDDIHLFPILRGFSVVKDLPWPEPVRAYVETMARRCDVDTFFDRAL
jgi:glutaredoxin 2